MQSIWYIWHMWRHLAWGPHGLAGLDESWLACWVFWFQVCFLWRGRLGFDPNHYLALKSGKRKVASMSISAALAISAPSLLMEEIAAFCSLLLLVGRLTLKSSPSSRVGGRGEIFLRGRSFSAALQREYTLQAFVLSFWPYSRDLLHPGPESRLAI